MVLSRREFLEDSAVLLAVAGLASGCATTGSLGVKGDDEKLEQILDPANYARLTKNWDLIYGPPVMVDEYYVGRHDFEGHKTKPGGISSPGIDYKVLIGIPVVPAVSCIVGDTGFTVGTGGYTLKMYHTNNHPPLIGHDIPLIGHTIRYAHLSKVFAKEDFKSKGNTSKGIPFRVITRGEIVALSGDTGRGPQEWGGVQRPHLHFGLLYRKNYDPVTNWYKNFEYIDPEKFGIGGKKPTFWDGKTDLDILPKDRRLYLQRVLKDFRRRVSNWPKADGLEELSGTLMHYFNQMESLGLTDGNYKTDSKHFQDIAALVWKTTIEQKTYLPGTEPYTLALEIWGYSSDQSVICTLPFIAPSLVAKGSGLGSYYKKVVYREGIFNSCYDGVCKKVEPPK